MSESSPRPSHISISPSRETTTPPSTSPRHVNYTNNPISTPVENNVDNEEPSEFCLRWNNYQANLVSVFEQLLEKQQFVDVTLCCEGYSVKVHKIVLSACSPYFQALFNDIPSDHPIIILKDVQWSELKSIVEFMYKGEIHISQEQIGSLLKLAELLKIRGLSEEQNEEREMVSKKIKESAVDSKSIKTSESMCNTGHQNEGRKRSRKSDLVDYSSNKMAKSDGNIDQKSEPVCDEENPIETFHSWLTGPSTSNNEYDNKDDITKLQNNNKNSTLSNYLKLKAPTWTPDQLRDAIHSVVNQELRFTQASIQYNIPKGTLYDNILGKSNRMQILDEAGITEEDELAVLEFCCDISTSPYNRRTKKPLSKIMEYMLGTLNLKFPNDSKFGYRWWWAFCKKYSISSLYYANNSH